jgi:hypothetical protein
VYAAKSLHEPATAAGINAFISSNLRQHMARCGDKNLPIHSSTTAHIKQQPANVNPARASSCKSQCGA